ncbi:MAG: F0F1 ATP synthase subunit alpha [Betaproteobacteria bacterium]|jgi:F-type H+-transporting ATPase subunit alpha|nr:F0F1 ATP synthase subunit alpha [Betaproteobacteria bacterium]
MSSSSSRRQPSLRAAHSHPPRVAPLAAQAARLDRYRFRPRLSEQGTVASIGDGIAWVTGLPSAAMSEVIDFEDGSRGLVFQLEETRIGVILLTDTARLTAGTIAHLSGNQLSITVGDQLLGRVVDPLGMPLDGGGPTTDSARRNLQSSSPPIIARDYVARPLYTGNKIVDTLIPIGRGQRQLLIGDNGTGKTSLALDTVINQAGQDVLCVVVLIGQKRSAVVDAIDTLREAGALAYTTVVVAEATAAPGLRYLAPYAGCAVAETWMWEGKDTLVVYDDLTTHARSYRELSLLLRRPPGREAYPGDIFHIHATLLERATCLLPGHGGGSMTALPVVETQQGEIAAYIPTNLISITDGQIYFDPALFSRAFLPAIDVSKSVSRIGGNAQHPSIKHEAGRMKLDYLQFLELEVFTRFGARLEATIEKRIRLGRLLREVLKQDRRAPLPIEFQMAWLVAYNDGLLDSVQPDRVGEALEKLLQWVRTAQPALTESRDRWTAAVHDALEGMTT